MSVDEIAHLKMKRLARKKSAVHDPYAEDHEIHVELPAKEVDNNSSQITKRNGIKKYNERTFKNHLNILQASKKDFSNVLTMLNSIRQDSDSKKSFEDSNIHNHTELQAKQNTGNLSYNRYDQERFNTERDTAGFKINTLGSFKGLMTKMV
uniref:Parafibromin (Trinotate prediction) n=1 Tax=Henneguya salminicola TaxID=69463 RepID=A0A6G3MGL5_HENSL